MYSCKDVTSRDKQVTQWHKSNHEKTKLNYSRGKKSKTEPQQKEKEKTADQTHCFPSVQRCILHALYLFAGTTNDARTPELTNNQTKIKQESPNNMKNVG